MSSSISELRRADFSVKRVFDRELSESEGSEKEEKVNVHFFFKKTCKYSLYLSYLLLSQNGDESSVKAPRMQRLSSSLSSVNDLVKEEVCICISN